LEYYIVIAQTTPMSMTKELASRIQFKGSSRDILGFTNFLVESR